MAQKKPKIETYKTPVFRAIFPHLHKARAFDEKSKPVYDVSGVFTGQDAATLEKLAEDYLAKAQAEFGTEKVFHNPVGPAKGDDGKIIPGAVKVKFKVTATFESKSGEVFDRRPDFFDSKGAPILDDELCGLGGGSEIRLNFTVYPWSNPGGVGLTFQPRAVQVVSRVPYGRTARDASAYGFGEIDGGFDASEAGSDSRDPEENGNEPQSGRDF